MAPMSTPRETSALLDSTEAGRQTGCLTIESADGRVCHVYVLMGKVFHAEGPAGEGQPALADALSWPDVTLSFDEKAHLPDKQTMTPGQTGGADITDSSCAASTGRFQTLSGNRRLTTAMFAYLGTGCLFAILMLVGIAAAVFEGVRHTRTVAVWGTAIVLLFPVAAIWLALYLRYRFMFRAAAVAVQGGLVKADIPRVVDAPAGVIAGEPELVVTLPARCLLGRLGKCHVEFYAAGVQIWKGPQHPEPRWQFSYEDLLQAESVVMEAFGTRNSQDQYSLRLIAAQPRMAFLFGNSTTNRDTQAMLNELAKRGVPTFTET
jgi:hypothetical protein